MRRSSSRGIPLQPTLRAQRVYFQGFSGFEVDTLSILDGVPLGLVAEGLLPFFVMTAGFLRNRFPTDGIRFRFLACPGQPNGSFCSVSGAAQTGRSQARANIQITLNRALEQRTEMHRSHTATPLSSSRPQKTAGSGEL